jgi:hypothetical protein
LTIRNPKLPIHVSKSKNRRFETTIDEDDSRRELCSSQGIRGRTNITLDTGRNYSLNHHRGSNFDDDADRETPADDEHLHLRIETLPNARTSSLLQLQTKDDRSNTNLKLPSEVPFKVINLTSELDD